MGLGIPQCLSNDPDSPFQAAEEWDLDDIGNPKGVWDWCLGGPMGPETRRGHGFLLGQEFG